MEKFICALLFVALFSCKSKEPTEADYKQRAIKSDDYKIVLANYTRVKDSLDVLKKRPVDSAAVIYEFNTMAGTSMTQVKTLSQVVNEMQKDTDFLTIVQKHLAATLAQHHRDSTKN